MTKDEILALLLEVANEIEKEEDCGRCRAHDEHHVCDRPNITEAIRRVLRQQMSWELFEYLRLERETLKRQPEEKTEEIRCKMDLVFLALTPDERKFLNSRENI